MDDVCGRAAGARFAAELKPNQTRFRGVTAARHGPFMGRDEARSGAGRQERRTVYYTGQVQGVGFRYTARAVAQPFEVAGFVRNMDDGRVQIVAEGIAEEIDAFLKRLADEMGRHIRRVDVSTSEASGEFDRFEIER
jgi:acylphosphatase